MHGRRSSIAVQPSQLLLPELIRYHLAENVLCVEAQTEEILSRCTWCQELIDEHGVDNILYVNLCGVLPAHMRSALNDNVVDCDMTDGYCKSLEELLLLSATVQSWLDASPTSVVAILYTFEKYGIASIVVACILKFSGMYGSPSMAYTYVTEKRTATLHQSIEQMAMSSGDCSNQSSSPSAPFAAAAAAQPRRRHSIFGLIDLPSIPSTKEAFGSLFHKKEIDQVPPEPSRPRERRSSIAQLADGFKDMIGLGRPKERQDDLVARSKMVVTQNESKYMPSLKRCLTNFSSMLEICGYTNEHPLLLSHIVLYGIPDFDGEGGFRPIFRIWKWSPADVELQSSSASHERSCLLWDSSICSLYDETLITYNSNSGHNFIMLPVETEDGLLSLSGNILVTCEHIAADMHVLDIPIPKAPLRPPVIENSESLDFSIEPVFSYLFHAGFVNEDVLHIPKLELDFANGDLRMDNEMYVKFVFQPLDSHAGDDHVGASANGDSAISSILKQHMLSKPVEVGESMYIRDAFTSVLTELRKKKGASSVMPTIEHADVVSQPTVPPPPPPPPPPGGPPPPPPPSGARTQESAAGSGLRKFYWKPLEGKVEDADEFVFHGEGDPDMDVNELRRMFSLSNHPPAAATRPKSSKPTVPTLLPVNRANIIQIFVTHLKTDMTKLRTAIVTGSDDWLTLEDVCDIQKMVPNAEEISLIRGHKGDVRLLSVADQFVAVMASIPLLNEKLDALRFRKQFPSHVSSIKEKATTVLQAVDEIHQSSGLKYLFKMILVVGNTLNNEHAKAFSLDSLSRLADTRSTIGDKSTLLHYLAKQLLRSNQDVSDLASQLPNLSAASQVRVSWLVSELESARAILERVSLLVAGGQTQGNELFASSMGEFLAAAAALLQDLTQTIEATKHSMTKLMKYLGSASSEFSDTEALGIIADFLAQFKKVFSEVLTLEKKKVAAEEARKKREALQLQRLKAAASAATVDASLQSTALRGSEGSASFTSPSLGPKAQAAVDSAREVVRRVLSNKGAGGSPRSSVSVEASPPASPSRIAFAHAPAVASVAEAAGVCDNMSSTEQHMQQQEPQNKAISSSLIFSAQAADP